MYGKNKKSFKKLCKNQVWRDRQKTRIRNLKYGYMAGTTLNMLDGIISPITLGIDLKELPTWQSKDEQQKKIDKLGGLFLGGLFYE